MEGDYLVQVLCPEFSVNRVYPYYDFAAVIVEPSQKVADEDSCRVLLRWRNGIFKVKDYAVSAKDDALLIAVSTLA